MAKHDWPTIKRHYVEGWEKAADADIPWPTIHWPSMEELGASFGIAASRVRDNAGKGNWAEERGAFVAQTGRKRAELVASARAAEAVKFDAKVYSAVALQINAILLKLRSFGDNPADAPALAQLANALRTAHATGRAALGDALPDEREDGGAFGQLLTNSGGKIQVEVIAKPPPALIDADDDGE